MSAGGTPARRLWVVVGIIVVLAVIVTAGRAWWHATRARERGRVTSTIARDSATATLQRAVTAMRSRDSVFANALMQRALPPGPAPIGEARRQRAVASVDFAAIHDRNAAAVAAVTSTAGDDIVTGTGFGISPDGTLLTSRDVANPGSRTPALQVRYANTDRWLPAHLVQKSDSDGLALIRVDSSGRYPTVTGVSKNGLLARAGSPVMTIGYPRPEQGMTSAAGLIAERQPMLVIDFYAGEAASGAPVFDARGEVVGVMVDGRRGVGWEAVRGFLGRR